MRACDHVSWGSAGLSSCGHGRGGTSETRALWSSAVQGVRWEGGERFREVFRRKHMVVAWRFRVWQIPSAKKRKRPLATVVRVDHRTISSRPFASSSPPVRPSSRKKRNAILDVFFLYKENLWVENMSLGN